MNDSQIPAVIIVALEGARLSTEEKSLKELGVPLIWRVINSVFRGSTTLKKAKSEVIMVGIRILHNLTVVPDTFTKINIPVKGKDGGEIYSLPLVVTRTRQPRSVFGRWTIYCGIDIGFPLDELKGLNASLLKSMPSPTAVNAIWQLRYCAKLSEIFKNISHGEITNITAWRKARKPTQAEAEAMIGKVSKS